MAEFKFKEGIQKYEGKTLIVFGGKVLVGTLMADNAAIMMFQELDEAAPIGKILPSSIWDKDKYTVGLIFEDIKSLDAVIERLKELRTKKSEYELQRNA